ncbi:MAG: YwiC-like family protein [Myxococcota bacterium]
MIPREHGAYAELLFPMVSVFAGGSPTRATWMMALGAVACFLANEPLLVVFGARGNRMRRDHGERAKRMLGVFAVVALTAGGAGLWWAPPRARVAVALPLLLGAGVAWVAIQGRERSRFGETLAAAALSSVALPLGLTAGLSVTVALTLTAVWLIAALLATAAVQLVVYQTRAKEELELRRARSMRAWLIGLSLGVVVAGAAVLFGTRGAGWISLGIAPVALVVAGVSIAQPTAHQLRSVGWGFVIANLSSLMIVVAVLRVGRG